MRRTYELESLSETGRIGTSIRNLILVSGEFQGCLPLQDTPDDVDVLAGAGEWFAEWNTMPSLDHLGTANTEPEPKAPAAELIKAGGRHRSHRRASSGNLHDCATHLEPLGLRSYCRPDSDGIGAIGLRCPYASIPERLHCCEEFRCLGDAGPPVADVQIQIHPTPIVDFRQNWHIMTVNMDVLAKSAILGVATIGAEALWAIARPAPDLPQFDASGTEGPSNGRPLHIAALGDSTTTGPGVDRPEDIWIRQLARMLTDFRVKISSFAVGGSRSMDVRYEQLEPAIQTAADITFVSVGANDALKAVPVRVSEQHTDEIVRRLSETETTVVLSGVGDLGTIPRLLPPLDRIMRMRGRAIDGVQQRVAERHGALKVDMWNLTTHQFRTNPDIFSADLFHPSRIGHQVWAEAAYVTIRPLVGHDGYQ